MAVKRPQRGLGRGLGALLGEDVVAAAQEEKRAESATQPALGLFNRHGNTSVL